MSTGEAPDLVHLLLRRFRWFDDALRASLEGQGWPPISSAQSLVFAHLDPEGTTTTELGRRIGVSRQAAQQVVAGLVDQGLLAMEPAPHDRRSRLVIITEQGRRNIAAAGRVIATLESVLADRLRAEVVDHLRSTLAADWGDPPIITRPSRRRPSS